MFNKIINTYNELRFGKERLRMELLSVQTDLDSYKAIAASAQARADYDAERARTSFKALEQMTFERDNYRTNFREQKEYTMLLVQKLSVTKGLAQRIMASSHLPVEAEMSDAK